MKNWVTPKRLAEQLNISQQTVQNWVKRGQIQYGKHEMFERIVVNPETAPEVKLTRGRRKKVVDGEKV